MADVATSRGRWHSNKGFKVVPALLIALAVIALGFAVVVAPGVSNHPGTANTGISNSSLSKTAASCSIGSWKMDSVTPRNGDWVAQGVPAIADANTPSEATQAAYSWLGLIKNQPGTLSGAAAYLLNKSVGLQTLVASNGYATCTAVTLVGQLKAALALANITPSQAPSSGVNSGTANGVVYSYHTSGVSGNRKAIAIAMLNGSTTWVMARCGNAVTKGTPPTPPPTMTCPPGEHPSPLQPWVCIVPKNAAAAPSVSPGIGGRGKTSPGSSPSSTASVPTDSTTGCNGPCPTASTSPTPAPSESPPPTQPPPTPIASDPPTPTAIPSPPPPGS